jgi:hypothetical protein
MDKKCKKCKNCSCFLDNICGNTDSHSFLLEVTEDMSCEYWSENTEKLNINNS